MMAAVDEHGARAPLCAVVFMRTSFRPTLGQHQRTSAAGLPAVARQPRERKCADVHPEGEKGAALRLLAWLLYHTRNTEDVPAQTHSILHECRQGSLDPRKRGRVGGGVTSRDVE